MLACKAAQRHLFVALGTPLKQLPIEAERCASRDGKLPSGALAHVWLHPASLAVAKVPRSVSRPKSPLDVRIRSLGSKRDGHHRFSSRAVAKAHCSNDSGIASHTYPMFSERSFHASMANESTAHGPSTFDNLLVQTFLRELHNTSSSASAEDRAPQLTTSVTGNFMFKQRTPESPLWRAPGNGQRKRCSSIHFADFLFQ